MPHFVGFADFHEVVTASQRRQISFYGAHRVVNIQKHVLLVRLIFVGPATQPGQLLLLRRSSPLATVSQSSRIHSFFSRVHAVSLGALASLNPVWHGSVHESWNNSSPKRSVCERWQSIRLPIRSGSISSANQMWSGQSKRLPTWVSKLHDLDIWDHVLLHVLFNARWPKWPNSPADPTYLSSWYIATVHV